MTLPDPKKYYTRFLEGHQGKLHFAAHSHHFWPDVTRDAHLQYWEDSARHSDHKWEYIFHEILPKTKRHIARILGLKHPEQIIIAPNTHELSARILSLFLGKDRLTILTTTNEFHSWRRQVLRLAEMSKVSVQEINSACILNERRKFIEDMKLELAKRPDLCFLSQVFFDSGIALTDDELLEIVSAAPKETIVVIDGYHGFAALPTNLSRLEGKIFYLGGGYKYAQSGEGVGFLVVPKGTWRPAYTGWFAEFTQLSHPSGKNVGYASDGMAFMGATQDPSGCYRFNAVWDLFDREDVTVEKIHHYVKDLQTHFIGLLPESFLEEFKLSPLFDKKLEWHGHFLTFESNRSEEAMAFLTSRNIVIDSRGNRLRFGFGTYQNKSDVQLLCQKIGPVK